MLKPLDLAIAAGTRLDAAADWLLTFGVLIVEGPLCSRADFVRLWFVAHDTACAAGHDLGTFVGHDGHSLAVASRVIMYPFEAGHCSKQGT